MKLSEQQTEKLKEMLAAPLAYISQMPKEQRKQSYKYMQSLAQDIERRLK